jgi:hypothetical protein
MVTKPHTANHQADFVPVEKDGAAVVVQAKTSRKRARVKIGGVFVTGDKASAAQLKHSVELSSRMLDRLASKVVKPGVRLYAGKTVPLYSVDPDQPGRVVRKLNGKVDLGVLENGAFKVIE